MLLFVSIILCWLLAIAFFTLFERKVMSSIQRRRGPNIVGFFGWFQPFSDGAKLLFKEFLYNMNAGIFIFFFSPIFVFICALFMVFLLPVNGLFCILDIPFTLLVVMCVSSFSIYGILLAGWSSNSKYSFLGGIRSASQMLSYELCIGTTFLSVALLSDGFSVHLISVSQSEIWFFFPLFPFYILSLICALAETNRSPFDLPEAEAELVAGYNVEYSSLSFALFFLAEYGNMLFMSCLIVFLFFGGVVSVGQRYLVLFILKCMLHNFFFVWVRAAFPRYRYDQLMSIGWKILIPCSFNFLLLECSIFLSASVF